MDPRDDDMTFVAVVCTQHNVQLWANGKCIDDEEMPKPAEDSDFGPFQIGCSFMSPSFKGIFGDFLFYEYTLTGKEVHDSWLRWRINLLRAGITDSVEDD